MRPVNGSISRMADEDLLIPVTGEGEEGDEDKEQLEAAQEGSEVAEATPTEEAHDEGKPAGEDFATKYEELRKKYEGDIGKLKSVFQKKESDLVKEKSVLERKLDEILESTMDDDAKRKYRQEKLEEDLKAVQEERDALKIQNEQITQFNIWKEYFLDAGISKSELKLDGELPDLFQSGMDALAAKIKGLEEKGKTQVTEQKTKGKTPQEVAQASKGAVPNATTLTDAIKHYANGNEEVFWKMAEARNPAVLQVLNELSEKQK